MEGRREAPASLPPQIILKIINNKKNISKDLIQ